MKVIIDTEEINYGAMHTKSHKELVSDIIDEFKEPSLNNQTKIELFCEHIESFSVEDFEQFINTKKLAKNFTKVDVVHAKCFGIPNVSNTFYSLIDRLQKHSEWKYPERKWNPEAYYGIAFQWKDKEKDLEKQVLKLEAEMELAKKESK